MHEFEFIKNKTIGIVYDITIGFLSVVAVFVVILQFNGNLNDYQMKILSYFDNAVYIMFLLDGMAKCFLATDFKKFIMSNKIDYLALIPFQFLVAGNLGSIFKLLRVVTYFLRIIDNMKVFLFTTGFFQIIVGTGVITFFGSLALYFFEKSGETISTYGDALWLSLVTLTTVGYGDISPKTTAGRVVAIILMLTGIGFLSMLTSTISSYLISMRDNREYIYIKEEDKVFIEITDLSEDKKDKLMSYYKFLKEN
ncbi:potassium channel family protein [Clostridium gasigenes]|uniref:potassium channel family protein n=1 Tax=Clostridium gasigenes TaxID=94869 RepID=UPI0014384C41|nr:potassium channel family protein [Clostridium gasigenes]NKF07329.1 potassium channel family protein [Clostridium gasigenes]QSW18302.1 potassium channel family protein [Clostridium gasigenes]